MNNTNNTSIGSIISTKTGESDQVVMNAIKTIAQNWSNLANREKEYIALTIGGRIQLARTLLVLEELFSNNKENVEV